MVSGMEFFPARRVMPDTQLDSLVKSRMWRRVITGALKHGSPVTKG
jgi:hypothetical protein